MDLLNVPRLADVCELTRDDMKAAFLKGSKPRVFMYHGTGTGKTHTALEMAGTLTAAYAVKAVHYVCPSQTLVPNIKAMATDVSAITWWSLTTLAKHVAGMSDARIVQMFAHTLVIVDEAHHWRETASESATHEQLGRLFVLLETVDLRLVAMSATPMRNMSYEIYNIMAIMCPSQLQGLTMDCFKRRFCTGYRLTEAGYDLVFQALANIVHVSREQIDSVAVEEEGVAVPPLRETLVVRHVMGTTQARIYTATLGEGAVRRLYTSSIAASLAVREKKKTYSVLYDYILGRVHECARRGHKMFVYCNVVNDMGIAALASVLVHGGCIAVTPKAQITRHRKRAKPGFLVVSGKLGKDEIKNHIQYFNAPQNSTGSRAVLVIGSRVMNEAITLKGVREIHITTPFWNNTEVEQAIGRGIRHNSHTRLPIVDRTATVFKHVVVPFPAPRPDLPLADYHNSLFLYMYAVAERKAEGIEDIANTFSAIDMDLDEL